MKMMILASLLATLLLTGQSLDRLNPVTYPYATEAPLLSVDIIEKTATAFMNQGCLVVTVTTKQKILELRPKDSTGFDMKAFPPDGPKEMVIECEAKL